MSRETLVQTRSSVVEEQSFTSEAALSDANASNEVPEDSDEEDFVYPADVANEAHEIKETTEVSLSKSPSHPSPAQLEAIYGAASSGDLSLLKRLFRSALENNELEAFALSNDASARTGFTALHAAASRGYLEIVEWLIEQCGAIPDVEDKEGETALHKASLQGHLDIVQYLLPDKADVHARDADGWTALHNACSKGYLDVVRWICESGGATSEIGGVPGVDVRSKGGWTPLMNAASKGHLPIVLYLLTKQSADPLIRNNWGETAYDAAAAVFEVWICEVLEKHELEKWKNSPESYNPLAVHTTVPIIVFENQRLDARLKTLAVSGGRPKFSASGLGKQGRRPPFELRLPKAEGAGPTLIPAWRSDVQLPLRENPMVLPMRSPSLEGIERSHFWLSDWALDVTHPGVDAEDGWQYASQFSVPDEQWTAMQSGELERLLTGSGTLTAGLVPPPARNSELGLSLNANSPIANVRRRRWVRVMRRRLDIPPLPFLQPDGHMYNLAENGLLVLCDNETLNDNDSNDGQELGAMPPTFLSSAQDYVARARYLVGTQSPDLDESSGQPSAVEVRRAIAKLERATTELRQGILGDVDNERKTQAEVLLNAYSRELDRRRLAAGAQGLLISEYDDDLYRDGGDSSDGEFHYPGSSISENRSGTASRNSDSGDHFNRPNMSRNPTDLTPHLSQASEFRVPTHEVPQKVLLHSPPTPRSLNTQWERDEAVNECRDCKRRFNFITRRHCRRCGRIFCDRCSAQRAVLEPSEIVHDPSVPVPPASTSSHRVCQTCYDEVNTNVPSRLQSPSAIPIERIIVDQERLTTPSHLSRSQSTSQLSDLADCPVCGQILSELGTVPEQEAHVKSCLEGGTGASTQTARYLVYKLPAQSTLVGTECVICLEEFMEGELIWLSSNKPRTDMPVQDRSLHGLAVCAVFTTGAYRLGSKEAETALFTLVNSLKLTSALKI